MAKTRKVSNNHVDAKRRRKRRVVMFDAQKRVCWRCGPTGPTMVLGDPQSPLYATFDEVTPRAKGGQPTRANQALSHKRCNHAHGCAPPTPAQLERLRQWRMGMALG